MDPPVTPAIVVRGPAWLREGQGFRRPRTSLAEQKLVCGFQKKPTGFILWDSGGEVVLLCGACVVFLVPCVLSSSTHPGFLRLHSHRTHTYTHTQAA